MIEIGLDGAAVGRRPHDGRGAAGRRREIGLPGHHPARVHPRRRRHRHRRTTSRSSRRSPRDGLAASPIREILIEQSIAGWKEYELEVMRDRADNVRGHLLDRERRPDGRAHRRLDHRRARADAHRRRVPAHARRGVRLHPPHRRRDRRLERAVRGRTRETGEQVVIEMNPRVSRSSRARVEGDRLPDRQDRRQARRRLHARRDPERHHRGDAGELRADDRLRRHQDPALGVREAARHVRMLGTQMQSVGEVMAIGRTFPESLQKALRSLETGRLGLNCDPAEPQYDGAGPTTSCSRDRRAPTPERLFHVGERAAPRRLDRAAPRASPDRPVVPRPDARDRRGARRARRRSGPAAHDAAPTGAGRSGSASATRQLALPVGRRPRPTCARARSRAGVRRHLQDRRHVRGRVRGARRRTTTAPTRTTTRSRRSTKPTVVILGSRARTASARASSSTTAACTPAFALARRRLRDGDGQLQPRDRLHRLRHERPALLRAAHARGRAQRHRAPRRRGGAARKVIVSLGGQTPLKLAGQLAASELGRRHLARRRSTSPRTASSGTRCASELRHPAACRRHRRRPRGRAGDRRPRSASRCWCARPTCSAAARCRSSTTATTSLGRWPSSRASAASARRAACRPSGPVLIDRFLEDAIEVDVDAHPRPHRRGAHRRRHGAHRGGRRALGRLRVRDPAARRCPTGSSRSSRPTRRRSPTALDVRGLLNVQYAVNGTARSTSSRPTRARAAPCRSSSKATGVPLAKVAARVMLGATLAELRDEGPAAPTRSTAATSR